MCTLQSKYRREAGHFLREGQRLIRLAARTNYMHQTRERGGEPRAAMRETNDAMDRLLDQLRMSARDESMSACRSLQRGDLMMTCSDCWGRGRVIAGSPGRVQNADPTCPTCEGTGEVEADTAPLM